MHRRRGVGGHMVDSRKSGTIGDAMEVIEDDQERRRVGGKDVVDEDARHSPRIEGGRQARADQPQQRRAAAGHG